MTDKRFRAALLRWSIAAGLLVAVFWGVWVQFAPLPPYFEPWEHPRLWWADALLMAVMVYGAGRAIRWMVADDDSNFGVSTAEKVGAIAGLCVVGAACGAVGTVVGLVAAGAAGASLCMLSGLAAGLVLGTTVGAPVGKAVGSIVNGIVPFRKLLDFLNAANIE